MNEKDMQHGIDYCGHDISGWIATEKYNGCRAYWDGKILWSRGGININIPASWREVLPAGVHLDGEIYDGIDGVYRCAKAIRYSHFTRTMQFIVFDAPSMESQYEERITLSSMYAKGPLVSAPMWRVGGIPFALYHLEKVLARGGEGLMLRHPSIQYKAGRTDQLLKFKELV